MEMRDENGYNLVENGHDLNKFRLFLSGHNLPKLENTDCILFAGLIGSGKSTTIGLLQGADYYFNREQNNYITEAPFVTPITSSGVLSTTLNITCYQNPRNGLLFVDTAGLNNNRGQEETLWAQSNLSLLFSIVRSFKAIVVVIDYDRSISGRGGIEVLAKEISKFTKNEDSLYQNMIFIINRAQNLHDDLLSVEELVREITNKKNAIRLSEITLRTSLTMRRAINPSFQPTEEDQKQLDSYGQIIKLFTEMLSNEGSSIIISPKPDDHAGQEEVRQNFIRKMATKIPINRAELIRIRREHIADNSFRFQNILSSLARNYAERLYQTRGLMERVVAFCNANATTLDDINANWGLVRTRLMDSNRDEIRRINDKIRLDEQGIRVLRNSTTQVVFDEQPILKEQNYPFWNYICYLWGGGSSVTDEYEYKRNLPFTRYTTEPPQGFSLETIINTPEQGQLRIIFKSPRRHNLNLKVKVWGPDNRHPTTIENIELKQQEIAKNTTQMHLLNQANNSIERAQDALSLIRIVVRGLEEDKAALTINISSLQNIIQTNEAASQWHAIKGLQSILRLIQRANLLHRDLLPINRENIDRFFEAYTGVDRFTQDSRLSSMVASVSNLTNCSPIESESVPATTTHFAFFRNPYPSLQRAYLANNNLRQQYRLEYGVSVLVMGFFLYARYSGLSDWFSVSLIGMGIFDVVSYCRTCVEDERDRMSDAFGKWLETVRGDILEQSQIAGRSTVDLAEFTIRRLTERFRFNVELNPTSLFSLINIDIPAIFRAIFGVKDGLPNPDNTSRATP